MGYTYIPEQESAHQCCWPEGEIPNLTRWKCDKCDQEWLFKKYVAPRKYGYWERIWPESRAATRKALFWSAIVVIAIILSLVISTR